MQHCPRMGGSPVWALSRMSEYPEMCSCQGGGMHAPSPWTASRFLGLPAASSLLASCPLAPLVFIAPALALAHRDSLGVRVVEHTAMVLVSVDVCRLIGWGRLVRDTTCRHTSCAYGKPTLPPGLAWSSCGREARECLGNKN